MNYKLKTTDCYDGLQNMDDESVTLCFTSPPYLDAINYTESVNEASWSRESKDYEKYKQKLLVRFEELSDVVKGGGHAVVNLSPIISDGKRLPIPFDFVSLMEELEWEFQEDIIWEKPVAKDRRSGVLLQHPYPGYYYPSVVAEYLLVFKKPAETKSNNDIYSHRSEKEKQRNELDLEEYQGEQSKNVWKIRQASPNEIDHPAPFPTELARRVIKFYSYRGDTVIDIFSGSGQCGIAAKQLERSYIGFDTEEEFTELAESRLNDTEEGSFIEEIHE